MVCEIGRQICLETMQVVIFGVQTDISIYLVCHKGSGSSQL